MDAHVAALNVLIDNLEAELLQADEMICKLQDKITLLMRSNRKLFQQVTELEHYKFMYEELCH